MIYQQTLQITTKGRSTINMTEQISNVLAQSKMNQGLCHVFLQHTSASLIFCENADPEVRFDLENFMSRLIPDGDPLFVHNAEGPDDMPAHIRNILTHTELTVPIKEGKLALGTWQGIYLWEHRQQAHTRHLLITLIG
jgi:secondary thiamine-phosphate synthase enzyme